MIRLTDGFDLCSYFGAALKYSGFNRTFNQGTMATGRDGFGQALFIENTAFGEVNYTAILDAQSTWGFNLDWQQSGGTPLTMEWYRIAAAGAVLLTLKLRSDGTMDVLGPLGTLLANTGSRSVGFTPGSWCTLELKATFGTSGTVELRKDGITAALVSGVNFGSTLPDRHTFRMQSFGPPGLILDNLIIWDGQPGDPFTTFYGRQRIQSLLPFADLQPGEWQPSTPGASYLMVNDGPTTPGGSPNGDTTYLLALPTGPDALFEMGPPTCSGLILGLAWNACARPDPTTATPQLDFVYLPTLSPVVVGNRTVSAVGYLNPDAPTATMNYLTYQIIAGLNPSTGSSWQDTEIANAVFGVGAAATPQQRLTAFYLEKVIDLTGKPFNCGGAGNYSY